MKRIKEKILNLLYPHRCAICDRTVREYERICPACRPKIRLIDGPICMKCGKKVKDEGELYCYDCKRRNFRYDRGFAVFEYDFIKDSLFRFKYGSRAEYAEFYATVTADRYAETLNKLGVEALIPVPVHRRRYNKRGYNQAAEYAEFLSGYTGIPVADKLIERKVNTVPLKKMSAGQRQKNIKKAFKLIQNDVNFKRVCIVDDIYTTGSTVDAIASILKDGGVKEVYFVAIAIGKGFA